MLAAAFAVLLVAFAAGLWGTIIRPPAYEVRGVLVARPAPDMILVRHEPIAALGMSAMELMAIVANPAVVDGARIGAGDQVRLAVRRRNGDVVLLRVEKIR